MTERRVGDAAGPHGVPDAVNLGFEFAGDHRSLSRSGVASLRSCLACNRAALTAASAF